MRDHRIIKRNGIEIVCYRHRHQLLSPELEDTAEMLERHGFAQWEMGGGCTAYGKVLDDGSRLIITNEHGHRIPEDHEVALLGHQKANENEDEMFWFYENTMTALTALVDRCNMPYVPSGRE